MPSRDTFSLATLSDEDRELKGYYHAWARRVQIHKDTTKNWQAGKNIQDQQTFQESIRK